MQIDITNAHFDLLSVAIAVAAIGLLGFVIYYNNRNSITNKTFLVFSLLTIVWGISNYAEYKFSTIMMTLWALRLHLFISLYHALFFFQLSYVFPKETVNFPKWYKFFIVPLVIFTSILTLTPFVFSGISQLALPGQVTNPERGLGIIIFVVTAIGLLIIGIIFLLIRTIKSRGVQFWQSIFILGGMFLTACLILLFNLILPVRFNNLSFIPLGALFVLPFIGLTSYTIYKHKLFNLKVAVTAVIVFLITVFSFINIIFSTQLIEVILNSTAFIIILFGSIQLIKSELKEINQREKIELLATELKTANDRLLLLDKQKTEFVSFATHQLRAPLTAIKGYASLILENEFGVISDGVRESISRIFESSKSLATMVDDYLNISRMELHTMSYSFDVINFKELVENVIGELKPNIEKRGLKLSFSRSPSLPKERFMIHADPDKFKQVISNLIDNSVKYTPSGSLDISIVKNAPERKITLSIKDTGVGIAPEVMPKIFEKFVRGDNANKQNIYGTGLGLFLAKEIVAAHHGKIWAESKGEGKGSTFFLEMEMAV